jgi:hypothetical protein
MTSMTKPTTAETTILANLELLKARLSAAASLAGDAARAMRGGERNLAIGTIIPFETLLLEIDLLSWRPPRRSKPSLSNSLPATSPPSAFVSG